MDRRPLLQQVLGEAWDRLAPVIRAHYDIAPGSSGKIIVQGELRVEFPRVLAPIIKLIRVCGGLVDRAGENIAVTVTQRTEPGSKDLYWHREFVYPDGQRRVFRSSMQIRGNSGLIEFVNPSLGMRLRVSERNGDLEFRSAGYVIRLGRRLLTVPEFLAPGYATITEHALSETDFALDFRIRHPIWGNSFAYRGRLRVLTAPGSSE